MQFNETTIANFYSDVIDRIAAADPADSTGFRKRHLQARRFRALNDQIQESGRKKNMEGALRFADKTLAEGGLEINETQQIMKTRAVIFDVMKKHPEAFKALEEARAFAPDGPNIPNIETCRKSLERSAARAAESEKVK
jgi:hypothetical protein